MLNINTIEIQDLLNKSISNQEQSKKILSIALAISLSKSCEIPNCQLDSPSLNDFFNTKVLLDLKNKIYSFNEQLVVDTSFVLDLTKANWLIRYNAAYPNLEQEIIVNEDYDFYSKVFGVDNYVSLDDYKLSNLNKFILFSLINKITRLTK